MPTFELRLDVHKRTARLPQQVVVRVGDTESQVLSVHLLDDGAEYKPASGTRARVDILKADGTWVRDSATLSGSTVTATLSAQAVSSPGDARLAHVVLWSGSRQESTEGFALRVLRDVPQTAEEAASYDAAMNELYEKWQAYEAAAERQEAARASAEGTRAANERTRQSQESTRQAQESARQAASSGAVRAANDATSSANAAAAKASVAASGADTARAAAERATGDANAAAKAANDAADTAKEAVTPSVYLHYGTRSDGSLGPVLTTVEED